ncbi:hypothetical protein KIPB_007931, partial [Kipferlia bialata]|eukprot:g7931.t1
MQASTSADCATIDFLPNELEAFAEGLIKVSISAYDGAVGAAGKDTYEEADRLVSTMSDCLVRLLKTKAQALEIANRSSSLAKLLSYVDCPDCGVSLSALRVVTVVAKGGDASRLTLINDHGILVKLLKLLFSSYALAKQDMDTLLIQQNKDRVTTMAQTLRALYGSETNQIMFHTLYELGHLLSILGIVVRLAPVDPRAACQVAIPILPLFNKEYGVTHKLRNFLGHLLCPKFGDNLHKAKSAEPEEMRREHLKRAIGAIATEAFEPEHLWNKAGETEALEYMDAFVVKAASVSEEQLESSIRSSKTVFKADQEDFKRVALGGELFIDPVYVRAFNQNPLYNVQQERLMIDLLARVNTEFYEGFVVAATKNRRIADVPKHVDNLVLMLTALRHLYDRK